MKPKTVYRILSIQCGKPKFVLEASTKSSGNRMTTFGFELEPLLEDFTSWVKQTNVDPDDLWYADIFEDEQHIGEIIMHNETTEVLPPKEKRKMFAHNRIIAKLKKEL